MNNSEKMAILCGKIDEDTLKSCQREWQLKVFDDWSETARFIRPLYQITLFKVAIKMYAYLVYHDFNISSVVNSISNNPNEPYMSYSEVFESMNNGVDYSEWDYDTLLDALKMMYEKVQTSRNILRHIKKDFEAK